MPVTTRDWVRGARPRTLTTALVPVAVGTGAAASLDAFRPGLAALALAVGLALQVAVNYANDYSDGVRGTDANRVGPDRLVASGRATPSAVKRAAIAAFFVGAVAGLALAIASREWWLLGAGALAVIAAWTYTGSSRPYGYRGWGELSVFVFFGPLATLGTLSAQAHQTPWWAAVASAGVGLMAVAMLLVNNIRDRASDELSGKRTLAVRAGEVPARRLFAASVLVPLALAVGLVGARPWSLLVLLALAPAVLVAGMVRAGAQGRALIPVFGITSALGLAYGVLLAIGLALG